MRRTRTFAALVAVMLALIAMLAVGCTTTSTESSEGDTEAEQTESFPVTITDDAGREVTIEAEPERIVSLAPANTEIVAALGLTDKLVGVTTFDDYPPEVAELPQVGDFVAPNIEAIAAAEPDLILGTTGVQAETIVQLEELGADVVAVDPQSLGAVFDAIGELAHQVDPVAAHPGPGQVRGAVAPRLEPLAVIAHG